MTPDTARAIQAARLIIGPRNPQTDLGAIMVTLETTVASLLLTLMDQQPLKAVAMLNEGLVPGIEGRIALFASRRGNTP